MESILVCFEVFELTGNPSIIELNSPTFDMLVTTDMGDKKLGNGCCTMVDEIDASAVDGTTHHHTLDVIRPCSFMACEEAAHAHSHAGA